MNKPTLKISELKKQGFFQDENSQVLDDKTRMYRLKFRYDNISRGQLNAKGDFIVANDERAILLLLHFESRGCHIRAAWLNPSHEKFAHSMGFRLDFKSHPLYLKIKSDE